MQRTTPLGQPQDYKTYRAIAPLETHWRAATCAEVACKWYVGGWQTIVDEATPLGEQRAAYIRGDKTRRYTERRDGPLTVFAFPPGQEGYHSLDHPDHQIRLDREARFQVLPGDWRGYDGGVEHTRPDFWVEDFAEHQTKIDQQANG